MNEASKQLLGNMMLFEGHGNISGRITKQSRFVGLKLILKHPDTIAILSKIGLQLDTIQSDLPVYLWHSSHNTPVATFTLDHTKSITFQWHTVTQEILAFVDDEVNAGGAYYIGYYEDDLTGQAIRKEVTWDGHGCATCTEAVVNRQYYSKWGKFVQVQPFYVNTFTALEMWDEDQEFYVAETNWGINLQLAIQCDAARMICAHANAMADVLSKQLTVDLMQEMAFSQRDNQLKQKVGQLAAVALDNQENGQYGAIKLLDRAVEAMDFDFSDMSPVCNPCQDGKYAARKTSVWGK
jgi:hypothetical protein